MRFEFNQGVPNKCIEWLWDNVGPGNLVPPQHKSTSFSKYAWFYERIYKPHPNPMTEGSYVPTITVRNPKLALLFAIRWAE